MKRRNEPELQKLERATFSNAHFRSDDDRQRPPSPTG